MEKIGYQNISSMYVIFRMQRKAAKKVLLKPPELFTNMCWPVHREQEMTESSVPRLPCKVLETLWSGLELSVAVVKESGDL